MVYSRANLLALLLLVLVSPLIGLAQETEELDYPKVNERTEYYVTMQEWSKLLKLGRAAIDQGVEFPALYERMGIAAYATAEYYTAIKFMKKVLAKNDFSKTAKQYLFWSYLEIGENSMAAEVWKTFPEDMKEEQPINKVMVIQSVHTDFITKIQTEIEGVGNIYLGSIGMSHRFGTNFDYYQNYSYFYQDYPPGPFNQHQYFGRGDLYLGKGWSIQPTFSFLKFRSDINDPLPVRIDDTIIIGPTPPPPNPPLPGIDTITTVFSGENIGFLSEKGFYPGLGFQKQMNRLMVGVFGIAGFYQNREFINSNISISTTINAFIPPDQNITINRDTSFTLNTRNDSSKSSFGFIVGEFSYVFPFWQDRLTLGFEGGVTISDGSTYGQINPFLSVRLGKLHWLTYQHFWNQSPISIEQKGLILNNSQEKVIQKIGLMWRGRVSKSVWLYAMTQYEQRQRPDPEDEQAFQNIPYYNLFFGVQIDINRLIKN